jgi:hypothetical protein
MNKTLLTLALLAASATSAQALTAGDLAFTSFNADEDGWSMVALTNVAANTKVYFTDNEWDGTAFNTGESYFQWTSGSAMVAAGSVIRFSTVDVAGLASSVGTLSRATVALSTNYGLSQTADTIYAYQGSSATAPTAFLAAITSGTYGTAADGSLLNTGLTVGNGAIQLKSSSDYAEYNGPRAGQNNFSDYKALVSNVANWNDLGDGSYAATIPSTTAFTVAAPVPEPETYAMLLAGLGLIGAIARRRRRNAA